MARSYYGRPAGRPRYPGHAANGRYRELRPVFYFPGPERKRLEERVAFEFLGQVEVDEVGVTVEIDAEQ